VFQGTTSEPGLTEAAYTAQRDTRRLRCSTRDPYRSTVEHFLRVNPNSAPAIALGASPRCDVRAGRAGMLQALAHRGSVLCSSERRADIIQSSLAHIKRPGRALPLHPLHSPSSLGCHLPSGICILLCHTRNDVVRLRLLPLYSLAIVHHACGEAQRALRAACDVRFPAMLSLRPSRESRADLPLQRCRAPMVRCLSFVSR
jgi:hypothetical protein